MFIYYGNVETIKNLTIDYGFLYLPDGRVIRYGVDTLNKLGSDVLGNPFLDEVLFKSYEEVESKIRYLKIKSNDILLDVGACVGSWSIYAAMYGATVHAFEIGDNQLLAMRANIHMNEVGDRITGYKLALVGDNHTQFVYRQGFHIYKKTDNDDDELEPVLTMTLDEWVRQFKAKLPHIEYIKIDVEGMEYDVLIGGLNTIKEYRPKLIIEIHDGDKPELRTNIEKLLKDLNYGHERVPGLNDYFYPNTSP